jgi:transposase
MRGTPKNMRAQIHYGAGVIVLAPIPDGFPYADLATGPCSGCAGTARRDFPMPRSHRSRVPRIPQRACHDCVGTGRMTAAVGSIMHRDLRTRP